MQIRKKFKQSELPFFIVQLSHFVKDAYIYQQATFLSCMCLIYATDI